MSSEPNNNFGDDEAVPVQNNEQAHHQERPRADAGHQRNVIALLGGAGTATAAGNRTTQAPLEMLEVLKGIRDRLPATDRALDPAFCVVDTPELKVPGVSMYMLIDGAAFMYTLILEACSEKIRPIEKPGPDGQVIEIDMPTSRYYDHFMRSEAERAVISDTLRRGLNRPSRVVSLGHVVIPSSLDIKDPRNVAPYYDAGIAAVKVRNCIDHEKATSNITARLLSSADITLVARHDVTPGTCERTLHGHTIATDFTIRLLARTLQQQNQNQNLHQANNEAYLSKVQGYIDFAYRGPDPQAMATRSQNPNAPITVPCYDPYLVLTNVSPLGDGSRTADNMLTQLLGIASVAGIASELRWLEIFTRSSLDSNSKASLGVFGLEHDPKMDLAGAHAAPMVLPVSNNNLPNEKAISPLKAVQSFCYPTMSVAMDVVHGGPLHFLQDIFLAAAQGGKYGSSATIVILHELDAFSNGAFSKFWDGSQPIFALPTTEIHLGHYVDDKGRQRDIRTLDYLTVLQASEGDKNIMEPYANGFRPGATELDIDRKRRIIKTFCPNVEFTGMATRIYFNGAFINALDEMLKACGLRITFEGLNSFNMANQRQSMFGQFATPIQSGAFQFNMGQQQAFQSPHAQYNGGMFA